MSYPQNGDSFVTINFCDVTLACVLLLHDASLVSHARHEHEVDWLQGCSAELQNWSPVLFSLSAVNTS